MVTNEATLSGCSNSREVASGWSGCSCQVLRFDHEFGAQMSTSSQCPQSNTWRPSADEISEAFERFPAVMEFRFASDAWVRMWFAMQSCRVRL